MQAVSQPVQPGFGAAVQQPVADLNHQATEDRFIDFGGQHDFAADQTREAAERFRTEEMEKARQEAEAFVERARADIQRERDTALQEVRASFGDLAITAAERVIRSSLDRTAHESLIAQVLEEGESLRRG